MFKFKRENFPKQEKEKTEDILSKYKNRRYVQPQDDAEALADRLRQDIQEKIDREQDAQIEEQEEQLEDQEEQIEELREDLEKLEELLEKESK